MSDGAFELRLFDEAGGQVALRRLDWAKDVPAMHRPGVHSLGDYLTLYAEPTRQAEGVADFGVWIAEQILGRDIFRVLLHPGGERTLRVRSDDEAGSPSWLLNLPWEIARASASEPTLGEGNLAIRLLATPAPTPEATPLAADGQPLRLLFVFAQTWGSRALGARRERLQLRRLFEDAIAPERYAVVDFLFEDVSVESLAGRLRRSRESGGYHIVHWSGHGAPNGLRLAGRRGAEDELTGQDLLSLFADTAGSIPRLVFLAACRSGEDAAPEVADAPGSSGGTNLARTLVGSGVPSAIAMRYAVSDAYACDLAVGFYRRLLAQPHRTSALDALTGTRLDLLRNDARSAYSPCDHATPVYHGVEMVVTAEPTDRPSPAAASPRPRGPVEPHVANEHFVGRHRELSALGASLSANRERGSAIALITGLGGVGKSALVAEALDLWGEDFRWTATFSVKPDALPFEAMLSALHQQLQAQPSSEYHRHLKIRPDHSLDRDATPMEDEAERRRGLVDNLMRALRSEAILLVLDNFEFNLRQQPPPADIGAGKAALRACRDLGWEEFLSRASDELAQAPSRILIASRRPLAALAGRRCQTIRLGVLRDDEVDLYFRDHPRLAGMAASTDAGEKGLAQRIRNASRGHPLLLDYLARLAGPAYRPRLLRALRALADRGDLASIGDAPTDERDDAAELAYLENALATFTDGLISELNPEDRVLLWIIALAGEPVSRDVVAGVWSREDVDAARRRALDAMLASALDDDDDAREPPSERPPPRLDERALDRLAAVGLILDMPRRADDADPWHACHETVRERILAWAGSHPADFETRTESSVLASYAERFESAFQALRLERLAAALEAGQRAIAFYARAGAYDRLASIANRVVTITRDPRFAQALVPHLEAAAISARGAGHWNCLLSLGVALTIAGRPGTSLAAFERAETLAEAAASTTSADVRRAWADLYAIRGNWAHALRDVGQLDASLRLQRGSAEAARRAGAPAVKALGAELEALRILILTDRPAEALPEVEAKLVLAGGWHARHVAGEHVAEAPDALFLARTLIGALDLARQANFALGEWEAALRHVDAALALKASLGMPGQDLAADRGNRSIALRRLGRLDEARSELEASLPIMRDNPASLAKLLSSLGLVLEAQGAVGHAIAQERRALSIRDSLANPRDRAISHFNLARYLRHDDEEPSATEAAGHQLSALVYQLRLGLKSDIGESLRACVEASARARAEGREFALPRLVQALRQPHHQTLANWLAERGDDLYLVQAEVDHTMGRGRADFEGGDGP